MFKNYLYFTEWNIGIGYRHTGQTLSEISQICDDNKVIWLSKKFDFQADPFLVEKDEKLFIFYEAFNHGWKNGHIRCRVLNQDFEEIDDFSINDINILNCHLSFPAIFEWNCDYYLIPESCRNKNLVIFKATNFPNNWKKIGGIENISLVDSIVKKNNNFFIMVSSDSNNLERKIFVSENLDGDWQAAEAKIEIDNNHTRLGGSFFKIEDNDYLPCQNTDLKDYGKSIWIKKMTIPKKPKDSKELWQEKTVIQIKSHSKRYPDGLHTLNFSDNYIVIDAKRWVFRPFDYLFFKIQSKIKKLSSKKS